MTESAFLRRLKLCCEAFGGRRKRARICRNVGPFGGPKWRGKDARGCDIGSPWRKKRPLRGAFRRVPYWFAGAISAECSGSMKQICS